MLNHCSSLQFMEKCPLRAVTPTFEEQPYQRCYMKKGILRNFTKFAAKNLCQSLFFNKVAGPCTGRRLLTFMVFSQQLKIYSGSVINIEDLGLKLCKCGWLVKISLQCEVNDVLRKRLFQCLCYYLWTKL